MTNRKCFDSKQLRRVQKNAEDGLYKPKFKIGDTIRIYNKNKKSSYTKTIKEIESQMEAIGENIRKEGQVYRAELEERQRLGLHGDAAIRHYNDWMKRYGMEHLMVKEG